MFCAYDCDKNLIAFHDSKKVVNKYIADVYKCHKIHLELGRIKEASEWKLKNKDDLYLVRVNDTYVQSGYLIYIQISSQQLVEDEEFAKDILYKMLEADRLTDKQARKIYNAIKVIEDVLYEDRNYIPTLNQLKTMKLDYDPYIYSSGLYY